MSIFCLKTSITYGKKQKYEAKLVKPFGDTFVKIEVLNSETSKLSIDFFDFLPEVSDC